MTSRIKVVLTPQVRNFAARLHPEHRRAIKAALRQLAAGKLEDVKPLEEELDGLQRLRVGKYRMVFRYLSDGSARCFFMESRRVVYDLLRQRPDLWD
jgi:mRNA-degrading endonuclease RelE of RelBE toxin-antitoxin system